MTVHHDTKVLPVYALVAAKNGPKLNTADTEAGFWMPMGLKGAVISMARRFHLRFGRGGLSRFMDRPVLDDDRD